MCRQADVFIETGVWDAEECAKCIHRMQERIKACKERQAKAVMIKGAVEKKQLGLWTKVE